MFHWDVPYPRPTTCDILSSFGQFKVCCPADSCSCSVLSVACIENNIHCRQLAIMFHWDVPYPRPTTCDILSSFGQFKVCCPADSCSYTMWQDIDGLVQERCNSSALALELHLSCTNPSISGTPDSMTAYNVTRAVIWIILRTLKQALYCFVFWTKLDGHLTHSVNVF